MLILLQVSTRQPRSSHLGGRAGVRSGLLGEPNRDVVEGLAAVPTFLAPPEDFPVWNPTVATLGVPRASIAVVADCTAAVEWASLHRPGVVIAGRPDTAEAGVAPLWSEHGGDSINIMIPEGLSGVETALRLCVSMLDKKVVGDDDASLLDTSTLGDRGRAVAFGPVAVMPEQVFLMGRVSRAFVNIKPVLAGHCLVASARPVARVADLTMDELSDLWATAQLAGRLLERAHGATALQFAVQDGAAAGQTVPHVHVHVVPRKPGDLVVSDDIYGLLDASSRTAIAEIAAAATSYWGLPEVASATPASQATRLDPPPSPASTSAPRGRSMESMVDEAAWYRRVLTAMQSMDDH